MFMTPELRQRCNLNNNRQGKSRYLLPLVFKFLNEKNEKYMVYNFIHLTKMTINIMD